MKRRIMSLLLVAFAIFVLTLVRAETKNVWIDNTYDSSTATIIGKLNVCI